MSGGAGSLGRSLGRSIGRSIDQALKRAIDVAGAATGLVVLAPVIAGVAVVVRRDLGRPVLFRQPRPGKDGRTFELIKFRTMRSGAAADGERLTATGRRLRAASLDELPTLWNVLRGDMSLVGPRPLLVEYLPRYSADQARRHDVRPGVTGWAQINGRNALSWDAKFALDVWYVDHRSLALDLRILLRTVAAVVRRQGISAPGEATMAPFLGNAAPAAVPDTAPAAADDGVAAPAPPALRLVR